MAFLTKYPAIPLPILQENAFLNNRIVIFVSNRSKCVFLQNRNTSSNFVNVNKIGNQGFIKPFVDVNKSLLDKQKNRKPEPAVKEHFRKFPFYLFFKII